MAFEDATLFSASVRDNVLNLSDPSNPRTFARIAFGSADGITLGLGSGVRSDYEILRELRKDFPETGAVLQAMLHRTEADCRALAYEGSRVRLCKGAYKEPPAVASPESVRNCDGWPATT